MIRAQVINKFQDYRGNLAVLTEYPTCHGVQLMQCGTSKMEVKFLGYAKGKSMYQTLHEGERHPDVVYAGTDGTKEHCLQWIKSNGFDMRGEP